MQSTSQAIKAGGICLIILAILTATVDVIEISWFAYPFKVTGTLREIIPLVFVNSAGLKEMLTLSCLIPLFLIPGSVGMRYFLSDGAKGTMAVAHSFAIIAVMAWVLNNMLWPSLNWYIGQSNLFSRPASEVELLIISGLNSLIYVYIGEYLRFVCLGMWIFLVSLAAYRTQRLPTWLCVVGMFFALIFWIVLLFRFFVGSSFLLEYGYHYLPLANFWLFMAGAFMVLRNKWVDNVAHSTSR